MDFGLIGKNVSNSLSKEIHSLFTEEYKYTLHNIDEDNFDDFMMHKRFKGLNITMPYKKDVIKYLFEKDDIVNSLNVANVIVNKKGKLYGYNTDYYGFLSLLDFYHIDVQNKEVAILGTGATSLTVKKVLEDLNAKKVYRVSCHKKVHLNTISVRRLYRRKPDIIVNTTPLGRVSYFNQTPIDVSKMSSTSIVIDVNYELKYPRLLLEAKECGKEVFNGLYMLVAQAKKTVELFLDKEITKEKEVEVFNILKNKNISFCLFGMPYSGKTTLGLKYKEKNNLDFIDSDKVITLVGNLPVNRIIEKYGIDYFRKLENETILELATIKNVLLAVGGGTLINKNNYDLLKQNFKFILLKRDINKITFSDDRPLSSNKDDYLKLLNDREEYYESIADKVIINDSLEESIKELEEYINEVSNY